MSRKKVFSEKPSGRRRAFGCSVIVVALVVSLVVGFLLGNRFTLDDVLGKLEDALERVSDLAGRSSGEKPPAPVTPQRSPSQTRGDDNRAHTPTEPLLGQEKPEIDPTKGYKNVEPSE